MFRPFCSFQYVLLPIICYLLPSGMLCPVFSFNYVMYVLSCSVCPIFTIFCVLFLAFISSHQEMDIKEDLNISLPIVISDRSKPPILEAEWLRYNKLNFGIIISSRMYETLVRNYITKLYITLHLKVLQYVYVASLIPNLSQWNIRLI